MTKDNNLLGKFELAGIPPAPRGVPQIEVTVDADGILNVTAADSSTGKTNKITITNDKGRLSQEEIEKMVNDAEKYKAEDDKERARVDSKNKLESYIFQAKATLDEEKLKDKFTDDDRKAIKDKADEIMKWLEDNPSAEKDEFDHHQKEMEKVFNPIISKVYQAAGGPPGGAGGMPGFPGATGGAPGGDTGSGAGGPTIEEVD